MSRGVMGNALFHGLSVGNGACVSEWVVVETFVVDGLIQWSNYLLNEFKATTLKSNPTHFSIYKSFRNIFHCCNHFDKRIDFDCKVLSNLKSSTIKIAGKTFCCLLTNWWKMDAKMIENMKTTYERLFVPNMHKMTY
jgi:hypothetical protein